MRPLLSFAVVLSASVLSLAPLAAVEVPLDVGWDASGWTFINGQEFPGATGSLAGPDGEKPGLTLSWNFSGGGAYVAGIYKGPIPPSTTGFTVPLTLDKPARVTLRITDSTQRTFQLRGQPVEAGSHSVSITTTEKWEVAWGGTDGAEPSTVTSVSVLVGKATPTTETGSLTINGISAISGADPALLAEPVKLPEVKLFLGSWKLEAVWVAQYRRPLLLGAFTSSSGKEAEVTVKLENAPGDWKETLHLAAGAKVPLHLPVPLPNGIGEGKGGKPKLVFSASAKGAVSEKAVTLTPVPPPKGK